MTDSTKNGRRFSFGALLVVLVPMLVFVIGFVIANHYRLRLADYNWYLHVRKFWEGNPSEIFSHWLDVVLMSGGAFVLAWMLSAEAVFRRRGDVRAVKMAFLGGWGCILVSGLVAIVLDGQHGEGTVMIAFPLFFLPVLSSWCYLLGKVAGLLRWRLWTVVSLSILFVVLHAKAQFAYEPSETGGPNGGFLLLWLGSIAIALLAALVSGVLSGKVQRVVDRMMGWKGAPAPEGSNQS